MTQKEIKALASEIVGDGQAPNKFFVTTSPHVMVIDEFGEHSSELLEGYTKDDSFIQVFDTYEEANDHFERIELDIYDGTAQVTMEDRLTGTIKENYLSKVVRTDYVLSGYDDAKQFGYEK